MKYAPVVQEVVDEVLKRLVDRCYELAVCRDQVRDLQAEVAKLTEEKGTLQALVSGANAEVNRDSARIKELVEERTRLRVKVSRLRSLLADMRTLVKQEIS